MADRWHREYVYRAALQAWTKYYKNNAIVIRKYLKCQRTKELEVKRRMMKRWLQRSANALRKLHAVKKMLKIRQKKLILNRFQAWTSEFMFFRSLDQKVVAHSCKYAVKNKG